MATRYPGHHSAVRLAPLSPEDSTQLVRNLLETETLPSGVGERISRQAEGNPYFVEELLRAFIDTGVLVRESAQGSWQATAWLSSLTLPDTIQGVIMARVDQLATPVKQVLRMAAVIGRTFVYRVLQEVGQAVSDLDQHLETLQRVDLIRQTPGASERVYSFKHALAWEAIYASILVRERRELHACVGQALEKLWAGRLEEYAGLMAYHYSQAEAWEPAQAFLLQAGDQAGRLAADTEALMHYQQALDAYGRAFGDGWEPIQRAVLDRKIGEALVQRGDYEQARLYVERALTTLGASLPVTRWGVRWALLSELAQQMLPLWAPGVRRPRRAEPANLAVQETVLLYRSLGWIETAANLERWALTACKALKIAKRHELSMVVAEAYVVLGVMFDRAAFLRMAGRCHCEALRLAEQIRHPFTTGHAHTGMLLHQFYQGELETALSHSRQAACAYREAGALREWGLANFYVALLTALRGDFPQALAYAEEEVQAGQAGADRQVWGWGLLGLGCMAQWQGRFDEARGYLQQAYEMLEAVPARLVSVIARSQMGRCYLRQGQLYTAVAVLEESQHYSTEWRLRGPDITPLCNGLAEVYLAAAEDADTATRAAWLKKAGRACRAAVKQGKIYRPGMPEALRLRGRYAWLRAKPQTAGRSWQRSLALAEGQGQPYEVGLTLLEMGQRLGDHGHVEHAAAIFNRIGAQWDEANARAWLGGSVLA